MRREISLTALLIAFTAIGVTAQDTTSKPPFKPEGKLWGYAFGDYYYKVHADSLNRGTGEYSNIKETANAFEFRRIYLGYDYQISEKFSAELLLAHEKNYDANSNRTVFIKSANVRWKNIFSKSDLVIGQSATPTWPLLTEKVWGYRSVEKMPEDIHKLGNSNDVGVALQGKLDSDGNYGYNLMVGNGTGSKAEGNVFKKIYGDVYAKLFEQKLILDAYADFERKQLAPYRIDVSTYKLFVAYQGKRVTIGAEGYYQLQDFIHYDGNTDITPLGVSFFSRANVIQDKLNLILRVDKYNPDIDVGPYAFKSNETFYVAGFDYMPDKNVHIMPNIWYTTYYSGNPALPEKESRDYDFVPRITAHYIFK